jgi:hypothetical protein
MGMSPLKAGLATLPAAAGLIVTAPFVGMGFSNGCASAAATSAVPEREVGAASGVSNMARYVGAALLTAAAATIYGTNAAEASPDAIVHGVTRSALLMAVTSAVGIAVALLYGRHRAPVDRVAAAAAAVHTVSPSGDLRRVGQP